MKTTMEAVTPVVVLQGLMTMALLGGFFFGLFTRQADFSALSMAWLAVCGWVVTYLPMMLVGLIVTALFLRGAR